MTCRHLVCSRAEDEWDIGTPDLIVDLPPYTMGAEAPDWWGMIPPVSSGLAEDRYVAAMEVKEVSDVEGGVGGKFIFHHAIITSTDENGRPNGSWPIHEVGRNAEIFDPTSWSDIESWITVHGTGRPYALERPRNHCSSAARFQVPSERL